MKKAKKMSRTLKDTKRKENHLSGIRLGRNMKLSAKEKRKKLKNETNPRVVKLKGANCWDYT